MSDTGEGAPDPAAAEPVLLTVVDGLATVTLNRPKALNAWNLALGVSLRAALEQVEQDPAVRAVVIRGAGRAFSSGADLRAAGQPDPLDPDGTAEPLTVERVLLERYHPIIEAVRRMPKPVLAVVQGGAVGIGASLALASDLILAAEDAYFLMAFVNIGLVPDGGSSLFLPARIGFTRAMEISMLGERVPAAKALDWGLVNFVVPGAELEERASAIAAKLVAGPTGTYAGMKRQLNRWVYEGMTTQLEFEAGIQGEMSRSADFAEGVMAFLERRDPRFGAM
jgi:2-(1,2-epoxy-1,2-dihydrophenyl)acetyl-CoA isomerase